MEITLTVKDLLRNHDKELRMLEVKREQLNLVQIAKRQNIPYGKLYHAYLVLGSLSEAIKVCRKG